MKLQGLTAATHTPLTESGELNLSAIPRLVEHLLQNNVHSVFISGTTGESLSLSVEERLLLTQRWVEVCRGTPMQIIVHVGSNSLPDSLALARDAARQNVFATSAVAPNYFKPKTTDALIQWNAALAAAAPDLPYYMYDIPPLTGVHFPVHQVLDEVGERIPNLAGVKYSNPDLFSYQLSLQAQGGRFDLPWGIDEYLLSALAVGARGGVGSSYNFAAKLYHRLLSAFNAGDWAAARGYQLQSARLIQVLAKFGYMAAAKATMGFLNVPVGPPRLPHTQLTTDQQKQLRLELETLGFFQWIQ